MLPEFDFIDVIKALIEMAVDKFWAMLALLFDATRHLGTFGGGMTMMLVAGLMVFAAYRYQKHVNDQLEEYPDDDVSIWRRELTYSLPYLVIFIISLPIRIAQAVASSIGSLISSLFGGEDEASEGKKKEQEEEEEKSHLAATLGPSFFLSSVITAVIFAVTKLLEPLLTLQLDLTKGSPAWQYLLLGGRPEMEWYIPLERFPYLGGVLAMLAWLSVWWFIARIVRIWHRKSLGTNLADAVDDPGVLSSWRTWFAATRLYETDETYNKWAVWLPIAAIPSLIWGWLMIGGTPYRMPSSLFAVSFVLWLGWSLHLLLDGRAHLVEPEPDEEPEAPAPTLVTWADILDDLEARLQITEPLTFERPRKIRALEAAGRSRAPGLISPLLSEIRDEGPGLTSMQQTLLETLSLQAFVHTDPPTNIDELELGSTSESGVQNRSQDRHRNQIVLAPEGSGKSTLAMLAAANHALMHTRSTLVVLRDEESARAFTQRFRARLEPSTLRWTVRVSRAGADLVNDLAQGITPDVLVCSLERLTLQILDEPSTYAPFLENLGLIIVDDVEAFCGPIEVHAQLAFRRLEARVREMTGVRQLGEESAPVVLAMGDDSMHDTPTWVRTLCGMDAVVRYFDYDEERLTAEDRKRPQEAAAEDEEPESAEEQKRVIDALQGAPAGRYQVFYRLGDFVTESGESVSLHDIIAACERLGVNWHYRPCGDEARGQGRRHLNLRQEPEFYTEDPGTAGVVFLQGTAPTVKREMRRLNRAGLAFDAREDDQADDELDVRGPLPVAFVAVSDPDEEMALTELNPNSTIAEVVGTLPRPVVRAPFGRVIDAHLAAELSDTWLEVDDVLSIFGNTASETLERLAREDMLLSEERTSLSDDATEYEDLLYVRVPTRAIASEEDTSRRALLPPKVSQVELPSGERVAIRDHTNLNVIDVSDAHSARHVFYPGRVIERASGRYVVVGTAAEAGASDEGGTVSETDIIVEPLLGDDLSSPRRRTRIEPRDGESLSGEPVFIGDFPMGVSLGPVHCETTHMATLRLAPRSHEIRQRILFGRENAEEKRRTTLETVALGMYPNPDLDVIAREDCPRLRLGDARLIAATMRAVLPAMYRGASSDIEVALHISAARADDDYELKSTDGFFLYDPHAGGNGAAAAIHRDGVDLLLRICRVYLERVLYHDRLLAR
ncbi:MAG: DEAD/DEAH box helicase family protein, partial [Myxococcota bacterium]